LGRQWRARCLNNLARRNTKLQPGTVIRLSRPLKFTGGHEGDLFTVCTLKRRGRNHIYFNAPNNGGLYRITSLDAIGYQIETSPTPGSSKSTGG
jgi:hypothetical protein